MTPEARSFYKRLISVSRIRSWSSLKTENSENLCQKLVRQSLIGGRQTYKNLQKNIKSMIFNFNTKGFDCCSGGTHQLHPAHDEPDIEFATSRDNIYCSEDMST